MADSTLLIAFIAGSFVLAGTVKGVLGMGMPALAMGLLGLVIPPVQAAALIAVPTIVTNLWQLAGPGFTALLQRFATMMLGVCVGTALGIGLLTGNGGPAVTAALGGVLAAYGLIGLSAVRFTVSRRAERWLSPLMGLATGVLTGATGVSVIPAAPYFSALGLDKDELIQVLGLNFTVCMVSLALALASRGHLPAATAAGSLLALVPAFAGIFLGQKLIRDRLSPDIFRRWFFAGLVVLGGYMLLRAFG